jgi:hypothetical protein
MLGVSGPEVVESVVVLEPLPVAEPLVETVVVPEAASLPLEPESEPPEVDEPASPGVSESSEHAEPRARATPRSPRAHAGWSTCITTAADVGRTARAGRA